MNQSRVVTLLLIDGKANGRIKCTLKNGSGIIAYKIPRDILDACKKGQGSITKILQNPGIYFLLRDEAEFQKGIIYIGRADVRANQQGLLGRIMEHNRKGDAHYNDWDTVLCFTSNTMEATGLGYLESNLTKMAFDAKRYEVKNQNIPPLGYISEENEATWEDFMYDVILLTRVLGYRVFEKPVLKPTRIPESSDYARTTTAPKNDISETEIVFCFRGKDYDAKAKMMGDKFILLKGSKKRDLSKKAPSCRETPIKKRKEFKDWVKDNITIADIPFDSPSGAAAFVALASLNGKLVWKTNDGKHPNDFTSSPSEKSK